MSSLDKETKKEIELAIIQELGKGYKNLNEQLFQYRTIMISQRMFILGIGIGIIGNLLASYLIEFHMLIMGKYTFWGILTGVIVFGIGLNYLERRYVNKNIKPIEKKIAELESFMQKVAEEIQKSVERRQAVIE